MNDPPERLRQAGLEVETLKWEESEGKGLDDYLKNRLTEHFYHIAGEERPSIQQEVLREVGWSDSSQQTHTASFAMTLQVSESPEQNRGDRSVSNSKGVSW